MSTWQELHNDNGSEESDKVVVTQEIEVNNYTVYEYKAEVELFRGIPCKAEILTMTRQIFDYDGDGSLVDELVLQPKEFPHYITTAAEKKAVEEL